MSGNMILDETSILLAFSIVFDMGFDKNGLPKVAPAIPEVERANSWATIPFDLEGVWSLTTPPFSQSLTSVLAVTDCLCTTINWGGFCEKEKRKLFTFYTLSQGLFFSLTKRMLFWPCWCCTLFTKDLWFVNMVWCWFCCGCPPNRVDDGSSSSSSKSS